MEYASQGAELFLAARDKKALIEVCEKIRSKGGKAHYKICDVTDRKAVRDTINSAFDIMERIDLAILNAGVGGYNLFQSWNNDQFHKVMDININGIVYALEFLVPAMIKQGGGIIAGIGSLADARGFPGSSTYSASKAAAAYILESARVELKRHGIRVITIRPGFVKSNITAKNQFHMPFLMEADKAAKIIAKGIQRKKQVISFPFPMAFSTKLVKVLPNFLFDLFMKNWKPEKDQ